MVFFVGVFLRAGVNRLGVVKPANLQQCMGIADGSPTRLKWGMCEIGGEGEK